MPQAVDPVIEIQKNVIKNASHRGGMILSNDQAHAFGLSGTLNKIKGIESLTDSNFMVWSRQILGSLEILFLHGYVVDKFYEDNGVSHDVNNINRRCILEFLYSRMDSDNSTRFRAAYNDIVIPIVDVEEEDEDEETEQIIRQIPESVKGPAHLWTAIKTFHQSDNEANLYLIQSKIEKFTQDFKTSITAHIDAFSKLKSELANRGGHINEAQLGRRLLHSLSDTHNNEVRTILRTVKPITTRAVIDALKQYEDENLEFSFYNSSKINTGMSNLKLANNTSKPKQTGPRQKCTLSRCLGPHPANKCFQRPENS
ncbi:uncharacterized protein PGTG_01144 [Puccinia graminis f. sp. tritici CRL 75-36-700-3]|uniref:Uncharacterized protein n=1 Tax=Puccinia graminis f. sp. tritici (strain CRL 75-36-700-3 / race SCCL) TaxID=418459 RepID=E3JUT8_PUCGT|nr:uncharacterized protein PGTG_01144 [Puccinia graminis f. sp. tritici CRL 75-36-700-3]EFP75813.1 hypothetical protein PGTG_01144 [Puccinia graminis f. sp. tritici CRL 75-36-700-3]